jgi:hypothetical protein
MVVGIIYAQKYKMLAGCRFSSNTDIFLVIGKQEHDSKAS